MLFFQLDHVNNHHDRYQHNGERCVISHLEKNIIPINSSTNLNRSTTTHHEVKRRAMIAGISRGYSQAVKMVVRLRIQHLVIIELNSNSLVFSFGR
jgi:hypothetical protein